MRVCVCSCGADDMKLALRKDPDVTADPKKLSEAPRNCRQWHEFLLVSIITLLQFIKDFSLDIKELKSETFLKDIDKLAAQFNQEEKLKKAESAFLKHKKRIGRFIDRQKRYLAEREKELKDIIDLLARAMVTLDTDNQQYNQKIYEQSEKIEQITRLDDIKKVKQALINEIENIQKTVREKQDRDSKQLKILSKQVSTLNLELKKAKADSVTDGLTGIYNRKAFDRFINDRVRQNTAAGNASAILMVDIDNFKEVNDAYGHPIGDRVLLAVAQKCQSLIRYEDFIARYGGEEFVIVLPYASLRNAIKKAKLICKAISDTRYSLEDVKAGQILSITVSIGVSIFQTGDTDKTLIGRADQALYIAKRTGKNRVVSENELTSTISVDTNDKFGL
jgi:diguanylate cyclase